VENILSGSSFLQKYVLFSVVKGAVSIPLFLYQVRDKRIGTAPLK